MMKFRFSLKDLATIGNLGREYEGQSQQASKAIRQHLRAVRGCQAITKAGQPCKAWAVQNAEPQLCASHLYKTRGKELTPEEREARERARQRPRCDCAAYPFPHRPNKGFCRAPEEPQAIWQPSYQSKLRRLVKRTTTRLKAKKSSP